MTTSKAADKAPEPTPAPTAPVPDVTTTDGQVVPLGTVTDTKPADELPYEGVGEGSSDLRTSQTETTEGSIVDKAEAVVTPFTE